MRTSILAKLLGALVAFVAFVALIALPARASPGADGFQVVAHPANRAAQALSRAELSRLFLRKTTRWPDGKRVLPVEPAAHDVRERFARRIHGKSATAIRAFWSQQIFSGRAVPPVEKGSDAEVATYVRDHPEAIGYVSKGANVAGLAVVTPTD